MNDTEFERKLLDSARGDAPTDDARAAWARFSAALGTMGATPGNAIGPRASGVPASPTDAPIGAAGARAAAMKWLLLGAIGGSAATTAVLIQIRSGRTHDIETLVARQTIAPTQVADATGTPAWRVSPDVRPPTPVKTRPASRTAHQNHAVGSRTRALPEPTGPELSDSTLAAQVSRIDAARAANAGGDYAEAIRLIERYHLDFPDGALAPDAEVVALEAVAATRDRPETARRAARFLSRYPDDPHAERVKWLAEHRGTGQP